MFIMTSDIRIGELEQVKPHKLNYETSVNSFVDTCTIELPRIKYLRNTKVQTADANERNEIQEFIIKEGDAVDVKLGYDGRNHRRFKGFVRRITQGIPVKIECEGFAYQLYDVIFSKAYASTTVKQIVTDVCQGTDIKISDEIPNIPIQAVTFKSATGIQVLEYLTKVVNLAVYFNFDELYVGTLFGSTKKTQKLKIGWNTIKDDNFKPRVLDRKVQINIVERSANGENKVILPDAQKYSAQKEVRIKAGLPTQTLIEIAQRLQNIENFGGHQGDVELFLEPEFDKGYVAEIDGFRFPEKSGRYFVESVKGSFSASGGRQTVSLNFLQQL